MTIGTSGDLSGAAGKINLAADPKIKKPTTLDVLLTLVESSKQIAETVAKGKKQNEEFLGRLIAQGDRAQESAASKGWQKSTFWVLLIVSLALAVFIVRQKNTQEPAKSDTSVNTSKVQATDELSKWQQKTDDSLGSALKEVTNLKTEVRNNLVTKDGLSIALAENSKALRADLTESTEKALVAVRNDCKTTSAEAKKILEGWQADQVRQAKLDAQNKSSTNATAVTTDPEVLRDIWCYQGAMMVAKVTEVRTTEIVSQQGVVQWMKDGKVNSWYGPVLISYPYTKGDVGSVIFTDVYNTPRELIKIQPGQVFRDQGGWIWYQYNGTLTRAPQGSEFIIQPSKK